MQGYMNLLGYEAVDRVTGFKGVVTSVCFDLYGCVQVALSPPATGDKLEQGHWFDAKRLKVAGKKPVMERPIFETLQAGQEIGPAPKPAARSLPPR